MSEQGAKKSTLRIEVGSARIAKSAVMKLKCDSVAVLDQRVEDLVDVYVDDVLIARGEMVRLDGKIGIRITELLGQIPLRAAA